MNTGVALPQEGAGSRRGHAPHGCPHWPPPPLSLVTGTLRARRERPRRARSEEGPRGGGSGSVTGGAMGARTGAGTGGGER